MPSPEPSIASAGLDPARGPKKIIVFARKLLLRLLRPTTQAVEARFSITHDRLDALAASHEQTERLARQAAAFGWDYVALVRRVTVLEDLVEDLRAELASSRRDDAPSTIPLPAPRRSAEP